MTKNVRFTFIILILVSIGLSSCAGRKTRKANKKATKEATKKHHQGGTESANSVAIKAANTAKSYLGTKYKYGGLDKKGLDCSGLMYLSYKEAGIELPRVSSQQSQVGKRVYIGELLIGDLIFFGSKPNSKKITHVGIVSYSKDGIVKFIHASSSKGVMESPITDVYWRPRYIMACRPTSK